MNTALVVDILIRNYLICNDLFKKLKLAFSHTKFVQNVVTLI